MSVSETEKTRLIIKFMLRYELTFGHLNICVRPWVHTLWCACVQTSLQKLVLIVSLSSLVIGRANLINVI